MQRFFITFCILLSSIIAYCQVPEGFNYQAVVRDDQNQLITNQNVKFRISVIENNLVVFVEKHLVMTDENGLVSFILGSGEIEEGNLLEAFKLGGGQAVKIEIDLQGGENFELLGESILSSVPYSFYSNYVNKNNLIWKLGDNENIYYNDGFVGIGTSSPGHHLEINADATGDDGINRQFVSVRNLNNTSRSYSAIGFSSGTDANKSDGAVGVTAMNFTAIPNLAGYSYLVNNENGITLRANGSTGKIKFWTGGEGQSFERMSILSNGNIGINNLNPEYNLDVNGTVNATNFLINGNPLAITETPWSINSSDIYYNDGYVGIGTTSPGHHLEINADATGDDGINRQFISVRNLNNTFKSYSAIGFSSGTDANKSDGAVGVTAMNFTAIPNLAGYSYLVNNENGITLRANGSTGKIKFWTGGEGQSFERMSILSNGNIGINNLNPEYNLDVNGTVNATNFLINGNPLAITETPWSINSSDIYYNDGYVGIGTTSPGHHLEINADATGDDGINRQFISVRNLNNTFKSYSAIGFSSGTDANKSDGAVGVTAMNFTAIPDLAGYSYLVNNENGITLRANGSTGKIKFWTGGEGQSFERMSILSNGNIGINNLNPQSKLQVSSGDVYIDQIGSGVIMKSPNGQCWRLTVDDSGNPSFASISCP